MLARIQLFFITVFLRFASSPFSLKSSIFSFFCLPIILRGSWCEPFSWALAHTIIRWVVERFLASWDVYPNASEQYQPAERQKQSIRRWNAGLSWYSTGNKTAGSALSAFGSALESLESLICCIWSSKNSLFCMAVKALALVYSWLRACREGSVRSWQVLAYNAATVLDMDLHWEMSKGGVALFLPCWLHKLERRIGVVNKCWVRVWGGGNRVEKALRKICVMW